MKPLLLALPALLSPTLVPSTQNQADVLIRQVAIVDVEHAGGS
jgi:hypothetical protein